VNNEITKKYRKRSEIIKALGHPTRIFIMDFLANGEKTAGEIVEKVGADKSTVSKHLSVMKNAGLVENEKRGLNVFYKLTCACILNLFTCLESIEKRD